MESRAFIKILNETEVGLTNTNDSYVYIRSDFDFSNFLLDGSDKSFPIMEDVISHKSYTFRFEKGNEQRLYKLGKYARTVGLKPGDKICLERRIINSETKYYISYIKRNNVVILRKFKDGFLMMRNDIGDSLTTKRLILKNGGQDVSFIIKFDKMIKKRKDSPNSVPFYQIDQETSSDIFSENYILLDFNKAQIKTLDFETIYFYDLKS